MIKRYCDGCGKEINTKNLETWWTVTVHGLFTSNRAFELCDDCYANTIAKLTKRGSENGNNDN